MTNDFTQYDPNLDDSNPIGNKRSAFAPPNGGTLRPESGDEDLPDLEDATGDDKVYDLNNGDGGHYDGINTGTRA